MLGHRKHFPDLPVSLSGAFANAIIATTQESTETSQCKKLMAEAYLLGEPEDEWLTTRYTDEDFCIMKLKKHTSLKAIIM